MTAPPRGRVSVDYRLQSIFFGSGDGVGRGLLSELVSKVLSLGSLRRQEGALFGLALEATPTASAPTLTAGPSSPSTTTKKNELEVNFDVSDSEHEFPTVTAPRTAACAVDDDVTSPHASLASHMAQHLQDPIHTACNPASTPALPHPASPIAPTAEE